MSVWGEAIEMRTAMPFGLCRRAMAVCLSPAARALSPSVRVCHINIETSQTQDALRKGGNDGIVDTTPSAPHRVAESIGSPPRTDVQRRQPGDDSQQNDDVWRQRATSFGLSNQPSRRCSAGRWLARAQIHSVGSPQYEATYDQHSSGWARQNPCTHTDRIKNAGPKGLCNHDKKRQHAKPAIPPQSGRGYPPVNAFIKLRIGRHRLGVRAWPCPASLRAAIPEDRSSRSLFPLRPERGSKC